MTSSPRLARALCFTAFLAMALPLFTCAADARPKKSPQPAPTPVAALEPVVNIRIDALMVSMPEEKFITLLPDLLDKDKIEKTIPELLEAVKRKEMILEGYPFIITKSGQRAIAETNKEVRYPTEFSASDAAPSDTQPTPASSQPAPAPAPSPTPAEGDPITFETRNAGVVLEVEPVVSNDGQFIDLNLAPRHVELLGFSNPAELAGKTDGLSKGDSKAALGQPLFYSMKATAGIVVRNGQHMLLAVHKKAKPEGYIEIFIIHAEVVPLDK